MTGPLLRFFELDASERRVFEQDVAARLASGHIPPTPGFFLRALHSWGIMCPHPIESRSYEGLYWSPDDIPFEECQWYSCGTCGCVVINRTDPR